MKAVLAVLLTLVLASQALADNIVDSLQAGSVTVRATSGMGTSQGSGVLVVRKSGEKTYTFVWTAAHVVDHLRNVRTYINPVTGTERKAIEFADAGIVQEFREDGRRVGETVVDARVLKYSDSEVGEDLALLQIRKTNFTPEAVGLKFYLGDEIPPVGTELYHVGSLLGQVGSNSLTTGVIAQHGRVLTFDGGPTVFDQTTVTSFPGSSGGGVFRKSDGQYVGMIVRGTVGGFNFMVPVRRIRDWAKRNNIEWAINPATALPSDAELAKIVVEDAGADPSPKEDKKSADSQAFYTLEIRN